MSLHNLPNELLLEVLKGLPDLHALLNLTIAYPRAKQLYETFYKEVLRSIIINSDMPLQLQKLFFTVFSVRSRGCFSSSEELKDWLMLHMEDETTKPVIDDFKDPAKILRVVVDVMKDIEIFEDGFLACRLGRPIQEEDTGEVADEPPPSATELHRIRRAFWRLHIYCALFHDLAPNAFASDRLKFANKRWAPCSFWHFLAVWELEEVECVYFHLWERYNALKATGMKSNKLEMKRIERMLNIRDGWNNSWKYMEELEFNELGTKGRFYITYSIPFARAIECGNDSSTVWQDNPTGASDRSAGWDGFLRGGLDVCDAIDRIKPVACYLAWGYCMWDEARLRKWAAHLCIQKQGLWSDEGVRRRDCAHCDTLIEFREQI